ncbi:response regulator [Fulvivirgaceae bacterium BMA10]|uniref:Response regulator n=1 Tax=Splendidivirga corallicola TaxID=3051826 RepID=A0ABT8KJK9_9BACT|nr:response regulator [Fulvivirgaceae bacterium BMA10]
MREFFIKREPLEPLTQNEFNKMKFLARVAFIDDEEVPHVARLQKDGYNIVHFPDIENIDDFVRKEYHVVILDIQGIGQHLSPNQEGWGVLKYLKDECPHIVVIMFTGADWSITEYKDLADRADAFIGKDLEFLDFKSKLDAGIRQAFSNDYHFNIAKSKIISEISNTTSIEEVKRIVNNYGANENKALRLIKKHIKNPDTLKTIGQLLTILNGIRKLKTGL